MDERIERPCEEIDAAIFSGDFLECEDRRKEFKVYLDRWNRSMRKENFKKFMHCGRRDCEWCNKRFGEQNAD